MQNTNKIQKELAKLDKETREIVLRVLSFDPDALRKSQHSIVPVTVQKPNVELFDDPTHNGQYYGV